MPKLYNLARMTTTTTGTGTITLGSAVSGFLTFAQAGAQDAEIVRYGIRDGTNSEVGYGTYAASGTTLTRNVLKSTNSNSAINLSGSGTEVYITAAAEDFGKWSNRRVAKTASYTVANTDAGATIALGGSAFFTLTFNAASGYDTDFSVRVLNEDAGRAKYLSVPSGSFYLWPGQVVEVFNQNNAWKIFGRARWKVPGGALTINTDFVNGSDTEGVSDGLATGAAAFKTVQATLQLLQREFDWTALPQTALTILMAAGTTDTSQIHFSPHGLVGAQGGASLLIDGNGSTLSAAGTDAIQLFYGAVVQFRRLNIVSGNAAIFMFKGAKCYVLDGMTYGSNPGACFAVDEGGAIELDNDFTVNGPLGGYLFYNQGGSITVPSPITATIGANVTVVNTVNAAFPGKTDLQKITWSLGGHTVTATNKYNITINGTLTGSAALPGSGAGSTASGGQAV
jgi:hypothetical protein